MEQNVRIVVAVDATGAERRLALLEQDGQVAFVCAIENYRGILAGERPRPMIGYPIECVRWADSGRPLQAQNSG